MTLSNTCKAAIKSVIYLASRHHENVKSTIKEIAQEINENEHTVGKLLQSLVRQGVINSNKGPSGGFYLSEEQFNQPISEIVFAIDGKNVFNKCGLGLEKCNELHPCPLHFEYKKGRDLIEKLFRKKIVSELCESVNNGEAFLAY
jgi:Rrf2 family protein